MKVLLFITAIVLLTSGCDTEKKSIPNIIFFLADDLGYGELGAYGQAKIRTPHLDALAKGGMRFTRHYSGAPVCAPARYILLTGLHNGHAYIRGNDDGGSEERFGITRKQSRIPILRDSARFQPTPLPWESNCKKPAIKPPSLANGG